MYVNTLEGRPRRKHGHYPQLDFPLLDRTLEYEVGASATMAIEYATSNWVNPSAGDIRIAKTLQDSNVSQN